MSVWQKQKNWWNEILWKPKKALSLDQLKFQHHMLSKNPVVTDHNKQLLVETFRSIAEILIWGDQNDSRVFDFFLEKNMQTFFLKTLSQKCGRYVCVQLLQTLNILFENIRNETSIYYLLSNNHINSIIVLKLDFSDEEVLAYYISFLKTLSFHLNKHTIHFFYNEHLRDFPLYAEAIKFFKHSENMVRIAVRTLTLNVFKVDDKTTLDYICNKTAAPYFSNLAWFIGNHVIELDECLISQAHHLNRGRLEQLVAEHLDHLHYINDIFNLNVQCLNDVLSDHFLNRLLIPLYIYSLVDDDSLGSEEKGPRISSTVSLFLLSQVFLILSHPSLVTPLAYLLFTGDTSLTLPPVLQSHKRENSYNSICAFVQPENSLETSLVHQSSLAHANPITMASLNNKQKRGGTKNSTDSQRSVGGFFGRQVSSSSMSASVGSVDIECYVDTVADDQYVIIETSPSANSSASSLMASQPVSSSNSPASKGRVLSPKKRSVPSKPPHGSEHHGIPIVDGQFLGSLMSALVIHSDDSRCLFGLSILYAMLNNKGIPRKLLEAFSLRPKLKASDEGTPQYNSELVALLLSILDSSTSASSSIRLITLRLAIMLLMELLTGGRPRPTPQEKGEKETAPPPPPSSSSSSKGPPGSTAGGQNMGEAAEAVTAAAAAAAAPAIMQDHHIALVEHIYESAILRLRLFYKGPHDEVFLDMFEDEHGKEMSFKLKVSFMMMDETMLLPPTNTPLTGIDFTRRLPCGEHEKARKAMRVFFAMRKLSQQMSGEEEEVLPLTKKENSAAIGEVVELSNCDLVSCKMVVGEKTSHHFMVFNETEFLLVDPHKTKMGCGVVHFIAFLQDIDISGDPADNHSLFVIVHSRNSAQKRPQLSGRFVFEDHIRCTAAKSVFQRARDHLHHAKMTKITKMLHLPSPESPTAIPVATASRQSSVEATPPTLVSTTPTPLSVTPPHGSSSGNGQHHQYTSSMVGGAFRRLSPSPAKKASSRQEIELSPIDVAQQKAVAAASQQHNHHHLNHHHYPPPPPSHQYQLPPALSLGGEVPSLDTPVRLTLPAPLTTTTADADASLLTTHPLLTPPPPLPPPHSHLSPTHQSRPDSAGDDFARLSPLRGQSPSLATSELSPSSSLHSVTDSGGGYRVDQSEEALTVSGGLFYRDVTPVPPSSLMMTFEEEEEEKERVGDFAEGKGEEEEEEPAKTGVVSDEGERPEGVCPLGVEMSMENAVLAVRDRFDATGESMVVRQPLQQQFSHQATSPSPPPPPPPSSSEQSACDISDGGREKAADKPTDLETQQQQQLKQQEHAVECGVGEVLISSATTEHAQKEMDIPCSVSTERVRGVSQLSADPCEEEDKNEDDGDDNGDGDEYVAPPQSSFSGKRERETAQLSTSDPDSPPSPLAAVESQSRLLATEHAQKASSRQQQSKSAESSLTSVHSTTPLRNGMLSSSLTVLGAHHTGDSATTATTTATTATTTTTTGNPSLVSSKSAASSSVELQLDVTAETGERTPPSPPLSSSNLQAEEEQ